MVSQKSKVNMPGVAPGKALTGIPVGDESAKDRVLALLGGSVAEDTYQVSFPFYAKGHINCSESCQSTSNSTYIQTILSIEFIQAILISHF
jgi:hypothetical protein